MFSVRPARAAALALTLAATLLASAAQAAPVSPWLTERPHKAVVIGGSISMYYAGNFGQYLQYGCPNLEVLNRGKVGAGGPALKKIFESTVLGDKALMAGVREGHAWVLFQGGLNSVGSPEMTVHFLAQLFQAAFTGGFRVVGLTLTPWGSDADKRFLGFDGLRIHRATEQVSDFILGKLAPEQALGRRAKDRPAEWQPGELPAIAIDLLRSPLRAGKSEELRDKAALEQAFAKGPYKKQASQKAALVAAAQAVPQNYLHKKYHDFDHVHPNGAGHRLIAALICQQAPQEWGCDCDAIRRAEWKGKVVAGK